MYNEQRINNIYKEILQINDNKRNTLLDRLEYVMNRQLGEA